jgi:hypothetical protein
MLTVNCLILVNILSNDNSPPELIASLPDTLSKHYKDGKFTLLDGLLYFRNRQYKILVLTDEQQIKNVLHKCHDIVSAGHLSEERTIERVKQTAWWVDWKNQVHQYILSACYSSETI